MQTVTLSEIALPKKAVAALGYFDGGHIGHRALLRETVRLAKRDGMIASVFSFPSLPTKVGTPLSTLDSRLAFFEEMGIDQVIVTPFDAVRALSAETFVQEILEKKCGIAYAVCGENYRFGKNASGDASLLQALLPRSVIAPYQVYEGAPISTTRIREMLATGNLSAANAMLGKPYQLSGQVVRGKALGKTLGFPTANIYPQTLLPRFGVYHTEVSLDGVCYRGLTDVGIRPTVEGEGEARVETYLPDFSGDLYGKTLKISFLSFLREEKRFSSQEALSAQIADDLAKIK